MRAFYAEKGFIQFAGFTAGKTQSYFDFFQGVFSYGGTFWGGGSDTLGQAINLFAYTAQFGNGISATLSAEDNTYRRNAIWDATNAKSGAGAVAGNALAIGALPGPDGTTYFGGSTCSGSPNNVTREDGTNHNCRVHDGRLCRDASSRHRRQLAGRSGLGHRADRRRAPSAAGQFLWQRYPDG